MMSAEFKCECVAKTVYGVKLHNANSGDLDFSIKGCKDCLAVFADVMGKDLSFISSKTENEKINLNNVKFEVVKIDKRQISNNPNMWDEGVYKYYYTIKATDMFGDSTNFEIVISNKKENNLLDLREKCVQFYQEYIEDKESDIGVGYIF